MIKVEVVLVKWVSWNHEAVLGADPRGAGTDVTA